MARHKKIGPQFYKSPADLVAHLVRTAQPAQDFELDPGADPTRSRYRHCPICNTGSWFKSTPQSDDLAQHIRHSHDLDYRPGWPHRQHESAAALQGALAFNADDNTPPQPYPSSFRYDMAHVPDWSVPDVQAYLSQWDGEHVIENTIDGELLQGTARDLKIRIETRQRHQLWIRYWIIDRADALRAAGFKVQTVDANRRRMLYVDSTVFDLVKALAMDHRAVDAFSLIADEWLSGVRHG